MSTGAGISTAFAPLAELDLAVITGDASWLSPGERRQVARFRSPQRRGLWLVGRRLSKLLATQAAGMPDTAAGMARWDIHSTDKAGRPARPRLALDGKSIGWSLSIAHCDDAVYVALATTPASYLGVDVMPQCSLGAAFSAFWFSPAEKAWVDSTSDPSACACLWAMKEAAYKALNRGESFAPRSWKIAADARGVFSCCRHGVPGRARVGRASGHITAIVVAAEENDA